LAVTAGDWSEVEIQQVEGRAGCVGRPDQVDKVGVLDLVQLQRPGERLQDLLRDTASAPAFEARLVLDRDARQQRHLLLTQPGPRRFRP
jgi:hypothetical protein